MNKFFDQMKRYAFEVSTIGPLGYMLAGDLAATMLAIPFIYLVSLIVRFAPSFFYLFFIVLIAFICGTLYLAIKGRDSHDLSAVVIDKAFGFSLTFLWIPLSIKVVLISFCLFHILNFFRPYIFYKLWRVNLEQLPSIVGLLLGDMVSGVTVNIFLLLVFWIAR